MRHRVHVFRNAYVRRRDALLRPGLFIIASARDGGNVLRARHARALQALIDWVTSVPVEAPDASGSTFTFHAVCLHYPPGRCFGNENARLVAQMFSDARGDAVGNMHFPENTHLPDSSRTRSTSPIRSIEHLCPSRMSR